MSSGQRRWLVLSSTWRHISYAKTGRGLESFFGSIQVVERADSEGAAEGICQEFLAWLRDLWSPSVNVQYPPSLSDFTRQLTPMLVFLVLASKFWMPTLHLIADQDRTTEHQQVGVHFGWSHLFYKSQRFPDIAIFISASSFPTLHSSLPEPFVCSVPRP